jgi:hypothetical protein
VFSEGDEDAEDIDDRDAMGIHASMQRMIENRQRKSAINQQSMSQIP